MKQYTILVISIISLQFALGQDTTSIQFHSKGDHLIESQINAMVKGPDLIRHGFTYGIYPTDNFLLALKLERSVFVREYSYQSGLVSRYLFGRNRLQPFLEISYTFGVTGSRFFDHISSPLNTFGINPGLSWTNKRGFILSFGCGFESFKREDNTIPYMEGRNEFPAIPIGIRISYLIK